MKDVDWIQYDTLWIFVRSWGSSTEQLPCFGRDSVFFSRTDTCWRERLNQTSSWRLISLNTSPPCCSKAVVLSTADLAWVLDVCGQHQGHLQSCVGSDSTQRLSLHPNLPVRTRAWRAQRCSPSLWKINHQTHRSRQTLSPPTHKHTHTHVHKGCFSGFANHKQAHKTLHRNTCTQTPHTNKFSHLPES